MKTKMVYIVTTGEYSDYRIVSVFLKKKVAEAFIEKHNKECHSYDQYEIEEWGVCSCTKADLKKKWFHIIMDKDGNLPNWCNEHHGEVDIPSKPYYCGGVNNDTHLVYVVTAKDFQHAVKIVNEKRIQILAAEAWGNEELFE